MLMDQVPTEQTGSWRLPQALRVGLLWTIFLILSLSSSWATVNAVRYPTGTPVAVCQPNDSNTACLQGSGGVTNLTPNVGIGSSAPGATLDVNGTIRTNYLNIGGLITGPLPSGDTSGATDYTNLTAAIASVPTGGTLFLPSTSLYYINAPLTISTAITVRGNTIASISPGENAVTACSQLYGTTIEQVTAADDILDLNGLNTSTNLENLNLCWGASGFGTNTGHGVNTTPSNTAHVGLMNFHFNNMQVVGHDGNHYGYDIVNVEYGTFTDLRASGGGGINISNINPNGNYGNSVFIHPVVFVNTAGTGNGYNLNSYSQTNNGGQLNLITFIRPQANVLTAAGINGQLSYDDLAGSITFTITNATNATPIVITTSATNSINNGQAVTIASVGGNTNANGSYYAKTIGYSGTTFALYSNANLSTAVAGNSAYTSGGTATYNTNPRKVTVVSPDFETEPYNNISLVSANTSIIGDIESSSTQANNNTNYGDNSGVPTMGQQNSWFGANAGQSNASGANNAGFGQNALNYSVADTGNSAFGSYSMQNMNGGGSNTAMGENAMQNYKSGSGDIAIGVDAEQATIPVTGATTATPIVITTQTQHGLVDGQAVTITGVGGNLPANTVGFAKETGYTSTTFGLYQNSGLTTGVVGVGTYTSGGSIAATASVSNNIAIGNGALITNSNQSSLTAVGNAALEDDVGGGNTALGYFAGAAINSGTNNVCIGSQACYQGGGVANAAVTQGTKNTFVGTQAGPTGPSSNSNQTGIGYQATTLGNYSAAYGYKASGTGAGATAIGTDSSGNGAQAPDTNEIVIGNSNHSLVVPGNMGIGIGTTSTPLGQLEVEGTLYPTIFYGNLTTPKQNVGIGTLTPGQALDVNGTVRSKNFLFSASNTGVQNVIQKTVRQMQTINQSVIVANHGVLLSTFSTGTTPTTQYNLYGAGGTFRVPYAMTQNAQNLSLLYSNTQVDGSGIEQAANNTITIKAAIEYNNYVIPVFFQGSSTITLQPNAFQKSDPIGLYIPSGAAFWVRTYVTVPASDNSFPINYHPNSTDGGDGYNGTGGSGTPGADLTNSGSGAVAGWSAYTYGPIAVYGTPAWTGTPPTLQLPQPPVVCGVGDSIITGFFGGSTTLGPLYDVGWFRTALGYPNETYASLRISSGGSKLYNFLAGGSYRQRQALFAGCDLFVDLYGTNDLASGQTSSQLISNLQTLVAEEHAVGAQVWVLTVPPVSTSTDAWLTTGNQTTASSNTNRVAVNTAIRNGTIPADKYIEFSGALESTQDSGIWNALGTSTVSGTITTTGSSVTTIGVNQTLTASSLIMKTIRMTSGSSSGQYGIIISNTTSSVTLLTSNLPTGVSANFTSVASGDSYEIHDAYTDDGIHPVYYEMATLASLLSTPLANFTN